MKYILASNSPRRKELLYKLISNFDVISPNIIETFPNDTKYTLNIKKLAYQKAHSVFMNTTGDRTIISADTIVLHNGTIVGKPKNNIDAFNILKKLENTTFKVLTRFMCYCRKK